MDQTQRPANWQPVFVRLVRADQKLHAVKLLALAFRYTTREGRPDFARAIMHFDAITSLNAPVPSGIEHPDIDETTLAPYRAKADVSGGVAIIAKQVSVTK